MDYPSHSTPTYHYLFICDLQTYSESSNYYHWDRAWESITFPMSISHEQKIQTMILSFFHGILSNLIIYSGFFFIWKIVIVYYSDNFELNNKSSYKDCLHAHRLTQPLHWGYIHEIVIIPHLTLVYTKQQGKFGPTLNIIIYKSFNFSFIFWSDQYSQFFHLLSK